MVIRRTRTLNDAEVVKITSFFIDYKPIKEAVFTDNLLREVKKEFIHI